MTSGGDCPGLNAVIRAVIAHARLSYNWQVLGIPYGTHGLATRQTIELSAHAINFAQVDPLLYTGGTILKSLNHPMKTDTEQAIIDGYHALQLDALVVIGGDGSQRIIRQYAIKGGWRVVGVPKTIDNDVGLTGMRT
jgi:ATP-dependent phosphofructokinase / diphosphate-dependent phosphofructokinase